MKKVELNFVDKAVAFFNPQAAVDRLASRAKLTKFEYDATMYNRQRRVPSSLSGAEGFRSTYDRVEMMKRARDLDQNFGIVRSLLLKFATHVAANISYQARTDSQNVNSDVEAYWNSWWDKCDLSGRHTGSILMQIATISFLRDGDFFFILVRDQDGNLKLQGIEADRIGDPFRTYTSLNHIGGIHINQETGAPDGYDVYLRTFGNAYLFQATIPASQVFHLYDPLRIDQYRGVTALCTAINDATDLYEITQMEKMAQKIASSQGGIVKRNNNNASDLASLANDLDANNNVIKIESIEPGRITYLEPGEEIQFPDSPNRPGNGFQEFHKILLRNICMGVGLPYSFAVDPSAMSGPTARLEMQQASRTFKRHQKLLEDKILRPVKNIVIADGVARGLIKNNLGTKSTKGIFNFGANVSIDLGRESQSAIAEFKTGLRTAADIYSERGLDFESSIQQRARETKMIADLAEKYGVPPAAVSDILAQGLGMPQTQFTQETPPPEDDGSNGGTDEIVPPIKPQDTESGESGGDGDVDVGEEREPTEKGAVESLPTGTTKEGKIAPKIPNTLEELDCGTGSGGFQPGNTCASGGGGEDKWNPKSKDPTKWTDDELRKGIEEANKLKGDARMNHPAAKEHLRRMTERIEKNSPGASSRPLIKKSPWKDATPAGYGPSESSESEESKRGGQLTTEQQSHIRAIQEGKTILKGNISKEKKEQIEKAIKSAEDKLKKTGYEKAKDIDQPYKKIFETLTEPDFKMLVAGMMGGIELAKYDGIDFTPPQGARDAAKRALEVREKKPASERGMTPVGIARARDLIAGKALSPDTIRRMHSFFSRHEVDKKGESWDKQGKGWQAWNGWGGDAGYAWVRKVIKQMESREKNLEEPAACPIATQDIKTNLANRKTAVDDANYGPANPNEPNGEYWRAKANEFQGDVATAKTMRCGNCAAFNQTKKMMDCISKGIGADANEVEMAGNLGYCEIFDFKCAAKRTCDAWIAGGPITDDKKKVETEFVAGRDCGQDEGGTFGPGNDCAVGYGRPAIKGGYSPKRPDGQFPKNYKRPTKKEEPKKPLPPKPLPPKPLPPKPLPTPKESPTEKIRGKFEKAGITTTLPENLDRVKDIESSYENLKAKGYSIPPPEYLLTGNLEEIYGASHAGSYAVATTMADGKPAIIYNTSFNKAGDSLKLELNDNVSKKWLATNDIFAHEYGHNLHMGQLGQEKSMEYMKNAFGNNSDHIKIAKEVSDYAQTNPLEFVAETFAGHINGKKYSKNVYKLYKLYGGPALK